MPDDGLRNAPDLVAGIRKTPAEVCVFAIGKPFIEPADGVEHLTVKGKVAGTRCRQITRCQISLCPAIVPFVGASRRPESQAGGDVLILKQRGDESDKPLRLWLATRVSEHDDFPVRRTYANVTLVRDRNTYSWRLLELQPPYMILVSQADMIKATIGCVNDDDLGWFFKGPSLRCHID